MHSWQYDPGEGKKKHAWNRDEAGFEPSGKGPVGKCPCSITREFAETLLNNGFPVFADDDLDVPERIYNVYQGVVYEARRTEYGKSFHGFPWRGDKGISRRIPARIVKQPVKKVLIRQAVQKFQVQGAKKVQGRSVFRHT